MPRFEFAATKRVFNRQRHGLGLDEARQLWEAPHLVIPAKNVRGEPRSAILGKIEGRVHVAIFTRRGGAVRLISCHRADARWEGIYENYIEGKGQA